MDYFIRAYRGEQEILGSLDSAIVRDAKTFRKVQNRLDWFKPSKGATQIKVFTFTNFYREETFKLVKTINL
jgi:hypothetical protein